MENHKLVLPEHLNQYGYLFGGNLLKWVDEFAWMAASLDYQDCNFVTIGLDRVEFKKSVKGGTIIRFNAEKIMSGITSVQYYVSAYRGRGRSDDKDMIFSTNVTFVRVDANGKKIPLPK